MTRQLRSDEGDFSARWQRRTSVGKHALWYAAGGIATQLLPGCVSAGEMQHEESPAPSISASSSAGIDPGVPSAAGLIELPAQAPSLPTPQSSAGPPSSGTTTPAETPASTSAPASPTSACTTRSPGDSPLRRLTRFEYSNTVSSLLGVDAHAGDQLPAELVGNGFGNDANAQPTSAFLVEQYARLASAMASAALSSGEALSRYSSCTLPIAEADEASCASEFVERFATSAYRRPLDDAEVDELLELQAAARGEMEFEASLGLVMEALLQSPDFLYRVEHGAIDDVGALRPTDFEMASRLSYLFTAGPPDSELQQSANDGLLRTNDQVRQQAERLVKTPEARSVVAYFFDNYLPINGLTDLSRDRELFPSFSPEIGALMHEETQRFLEHVVFDGDGTWDAALTAPFTFVNAKLAAFYGLAGVEGDEFQRVELDPGKRLGLLTQGALLTGTTVSNVTNPVRRGGYLLSHLLCVDVPRPPPELLARVKPPEPYSGKTGRERYTAHSAEEACAGCHAILDPPGFALENFDAVGLWRDQEGGETIDASGELAYFPEAFDGPVELVEQIAASEATYMCFAKNWQTFAYGRELADADLCNQEQLTQSFTQSKHNVAQLLVDLTQTDGFLYLGTEADSEEQP